MHKLGYGSDNRLKIKVSVRDLPYLRDPAVILTDQLKEVYIDGQLETIDTTNWFPRVMRKDYIVALTGAGSGPDPDQNLPRLLRASVSSGKATWSGSQTECSGGTLRAERWREGQRDR